MAKFPQWLGGKGRAPSLLTDAGFEMVAASAPSAFPKLLPLEQLGFRCLNRHGISNNLAFDENLSYGKGGA